MPRSFAATSTLALAAASTILIAAPARPAIVDFYVYHSLSYTQDASGLSAPDTSVQSIILTDVNGEFDGGSVTGPDASVASVIDVSGPGYPVGQFDAYLGPQPFGTFTVNLSNSVTSATGSASLTYDADHYPDVAPEVSNYAALQHFDPSVDNSIVLTSGFTPSGDETSASTTFFIYDETTDARLLQYSEPPGTTVFDVPALTASPGEKIGYYFESDIDYDVNVDGVLDDNIYRDITTGEINAAVSPAPEPSTWAMMLVGFGGLGALLRLRRAPRESPAN
jgi:hypothetical protein